ncbi:MAG: phenylacetate--CoA ligase, partial [Lachnospiraceae bacterium]|nr:phenylacetate--CoA ligase [Lachnospiraceae bacterium]
MIFQPEIECASADEIRDIQLKYLRDTVKRCYENVPHYRRKFDELGIKPEDVKELSDLQKLPFTVKNDLRDNYPYDLFAVPMRDIVRLHASSGTTGKPIVVGYTKKDLDVWSDMIARIAYAAGATPYDIVQISFGYGLFTGGFGLHYGMEKLGATVVPISAGNSERQINIMKDFGSTILVSTPSYSLYLYEYMK